MFNFGTVARTRAEYTGEEKRVMSFEEEETLFGKVTTAWFWIYGPSYLIDFYRGAKLYVAHPVRTVKDARFWAARPKKIGAMVYYHGEGPYAVTGISPDNEDDIFINYNNENIMVSYSNCCYPLKN